MKYFPYINEPKPWSLWDRLRLFFRPTFEGHGYYFKLMDGAIWIVKESPRGK